MELPLWVVVREGLASMLELETTWSLDDVARAMALVEMKQDIELLLTKDIPGGRT